MTKTPFQKDRAFVKENIDKLETRLQVCEEIGMVDPLDEFYNEMESLREDLSEIESYPELAEAILKAQLFEKRLDRWLSSKGETTIALSWPTIPESEESL